MEYFVVPHTHFDIGFTDQPEEVVRQQLYNLDLALRYCEADSDYRWLIESSRLLREWLASRPEGLKRRLISLLRSGQMEVGALDMQILTETASFSDMLENVRRTTELGRKYGFPVTTAVLDDIGGLAGELPLALNAYGIKYFVLGTGICQTEVPWANLPYLFYLKSRGGGKILVWNIGCDRQMRSVDAQFENAGYATGAWYLGYHAFNEFLHKLDLGIFNPVFGDSREKPMPTRELFGKLEERIKRNGYPYQECLLQYGGDNRPPSPDFGKLIRAINASGQFPKMKLSSTTEFFRKMETEHAGEIPVLEGILTDPWNLRINAVPSVLKASRAAQRRQNYLQLKGIHDDALNENLLLISDHTLGLNIWEWQNIVKNSPDGIRSPEFDAVRESWRRKRLYAEDARRRADELIHRLPDVQGEIPGIAVRNMAAHAVSGNAELYLGSYAPRLLSLKDNDGNEIPRQLIGCNRWMLQVSDVAALGIKQLFPQFDEKYDQKSTPLSETVPAELKCGNFRLYFQNDALMQITASDGTEMLDGAFALGEPLCEVIGDLPITNEYNSLKECTERVLYRPANSQAKLTADGELFTEITTQCALHHGSARLVMRIWKQMPRIDLRVRLDQPESTDKQCFYMALPFAGKDGRHYFDQNAGLVTLDRLLPGAMQDLFLCSQYAALETPRGTAVLCCPDAPVVEFGGMNTARWRKSLPYKPQSNAMFAMLANNVSNTDAPAWLPIFDEFNFSLFLSTSPFCPGTAQANFEAVTALEARLSYASQTTGISGLPKEIRMHATPNGFALENLSGRQIDFSFQFAEKNYTASVPPYGIHIF